MGAWAFDNISINLSTEIWRSLVKHNAPGLLLLCILAISLCYPFFHAVLQRYSQIYAEKLDGDQQTVVVQHAIEAVILLLLFVPYTYMVLSTFFEELPLEHLAGRFVALGFFMSTVMTMYMFEVATRYSNLRPMVFGHHFCAYLDGIITAFFLGTANIKAAFLLVYFITYEAPLFIGLVLYRLAPAHRFTCPTMMSGMLIFGFSRPFQLLSVIGSLLATGLGNLVLWQVVLQITLATCFTALQLYSLTIHYKIYRKALQKREQLKVRSVTDNSYSENQNGAEQPNGMKASQARCPGDCL